jgi:hypothetical protein
MSQIEHQAPVFLLNCIEHLTFCWPCIIMYHNNATNLIHFHFHNHFIVSEFSTFFGRQASIFRRHYTSSFWCELRALVAVGWLLLVYGWTLWTGHRSILSRPPIEDIEWNAEMHLILKKRLELMTPVPRATHSGKRGHWMFVFCFLEGYPH